MVKPRIRPLERKVLRDTVYDSLISMLLSGALEPNAPLSIDGLAHDLEVSPTPVREALVHLERTGLVSRAPLRGYRVSPPLSPEQIGQLADVRMIVETGALELAFEHLDKLIPALEKAHAAHVKAGERVAGVVPDKDNIAPYRAYMDADWDFHHTLFLQANNSYLLAMGESLPAHLHRLRQSVNRGVNDSKLAIKEHEAILKGVQAGDLPAALAALRAHITGVRERTVQDERDSNN